MVTAVLVFMGGVLLVCTIIAVVFLVDAYGEDD